MCLTVSNSSEDSVEIRSEKSRRVVLVLLSLLGQIESIENGQLRLSWGSGGAGSGVGIKWVIEAHGHDADGLGRG